VLVAAILSACSGGGGGGGGGSAPVATDDSYSSQPGNTTIIVALPGVLSNDAGSGIAADLVDPPANHSGTFTLNADGSFTYVLRSTSSAPTDSFTYRARNGTTTSNLATVTINITPPIAAADSFSVSAPSGPTSGNVLVNDNGSGLTAALMGAPAHAASFALNSNGSFSYTHNGDGAATDKFSYRAMMGSIASNTVEVTININQPPLASNACPSIVDGQSSVTGNLIATDPNLTAPTFEIVTQPGHGTVSTTPAGVFTYVPTANSFRRGMDKFTFRAKDATNPSLYSQPATVAILNGSMVRIMPVGDSITQGVTYGGGCDTDGNCPVRSDRIGYRKKLFTDLTNPTVMPHFPVQLVGGLSDGSNLGLASPNDQHHGHPGDCTGPTPGGATGWCQQNDVYSSSIKRNLSSNIISWLDNSPADIILLHSGTNDLSTDANAGNADANTLLNNISSWAQSNYPVTVFIARIIPTRDNTLNVDGFNNAVSSVATSRAGVTVPPMVNQQAQFWLGTGTIADRNTADPVLMTAADVNGLHPNQTGYDKMADKWKADLIASGVLPNCP
jgi:lysophospholipase L1-like esterase